MKRLLFVIVVVGTVVLMAWLDSGMDAEAKHQPEMAPPPCAEVVVWPTDANCQAYNKLVGLPVPEEYRVSD